MKSVTWKGRTVKTGIYKTPVQGSLKVEGVNIVGDDQADRRVHGGKNKAIYAYPSEHYQFWRNEFPEKELPYGMFGENLTTKGLIETEVNVGDIFKIGSAELIAVQPRIPCYKLGIKFGTKSIIKKFEEAGFPGIYFKIGKEGTLKVNDEIIQIHQDSNNVSITDVRKIQRGLAQVSLLERALNLEHLPPGIKRHVFYE